MKPRDDQGFPIQNLKSKIQNDIISPVEKKMYFMLRFNQSIARNVCAELAT